jgi:hypothetical protein
MLEILILKQIQQVQSLNGWFFLEYKPEQIRSLEHQSIHIDCCVASFEQSKLKQSRSPTTEWKTYTVKNKSEYRVYAINRYPQYNT